MFVWIRGGICLDKGVCLNKTKRCMFVWIRSYVWIREMYVRIRVCMFG